MTQNRILAAGRRRFAELCFQDADGAGTACDCDDTDPATYPGAEEVNDGVDNQCPGDAGYGVTDETSSESGFYNPNDKNEYSWPAQIGATLYEAARSSEPTFSIDCLTLTTASTLWVDTAQPIAGAVFFYLTRSAAPNMGTWGQDSAGTPRTVCP